MVETGDKSNLKEQSHPNVFEINEDMMEYFAFYIDENPNPDTEALGSIYVSLLSGQDVSLDFPGRDTIWATSEDMEVYFSYDGLNHLLKGLFYGGDEDDEELVMKEPLNIEKALIGRREKVVIRGLPTSKLGEEGGEIF